MVSRLEIVVGKWLAWTGFGMVSAIGATVVGIAVGTVPPGPWVLCIPMVPALTVAFGLWLVRRSPDVMAGTTISLRVIPAALSTAALASWFALQMELDWLAAALPMGGILMGAGALFDESLPLLLLALGSSSLATVALLAATARDLEQAAPALSPLNRSVRGWVGLHLRAALLWHFTLTGSLIWGIASSTSAAQVPASAGPLAAGAVLFGLTLLNWAAPGAPNPRRPTWSPARTVLAAIGIGLCLALAPGLSLGSNGAYIGRLLDAQNATWAGPIVWGVAMLGQEAFFRGLVLRNYGVLGAILGSVLIATPTEPLMGLAIAAPLTLLVQRSGQWWPVLIANLVWALVGDLAVLPPLAAAIVLVGATAFLAQRPTGEASPAA